jgi:hypothetical protein
MVLFVCARIHSLESTVTQITRFVGITLTSARETGHASRTPRIAQLSIGAVVIHLGVGIVRAVHQVMVELIVNRVIIHGRVRTVSRTGETVNRVLVKMVEHVFR